MDKTEELCGRLPKAMDAAWATAAAERIEDCVSRPIPLVSTSGGPVQQLHLLAVTHDDATNPALLAAAWERLRPDAVALDVQPPYPKSFNRMARAMPPGLLEGLMGAPLGALGAALDAADDVDRLKWHHAILEVVASGASPIHVSEDALVNAFANRDLLFAECIAAAALAARPAPGGGPAVLVHGIDLEEDDPLQAQLEPGDWFTDADVASYRQRLLGAAEGGLRAAVNTWLQGIPAGTSSTVPRQRFVLTRLEQALGRARFNEFQAADAAWRLAHADSKARLQQEAWKTQAAHMLSRLGDIASGRVGGRRCERLLAVVGSAAAVRIRALAEARARAEAATAGAA
ncbi:hypothetical protein HYH03_012783 [Edaphochlamys debaryana]|uniref:Uncharacterized protein n=1 Tax=Edaphochlamys debaryana TaxID=47281 RepID=A0A836BTQ2_9CHLO|nr:hypothetical protein HYH03_012783 [Edaphochlamys debaryana]|eukprot:KAG2488786.1 hypothetical protein HYH03_012783 [Edaphochlamys debaryana]